MVPILNPPPTSRPVLADFLTNVFAFDSNVMLLTHHHLLPLLSFPLLSSSLFPSIPSFPLPSLSLSFPFFGTYHEQGTGGSAEEGQTVSFISLFLDSEEGMRCVVIQHAAAAAAAKSLQSCPTLCDPIDGSPSGSPVPGILQARTLEWVAISFSNA